MTEPKPLPTGRMIRAARGLLGLSREKIAQAAGVDMISVARIERETVPSRNPIRIRTVGKIADLLEAEHGIVFIHGDEAVAEGVGLRRPRLQSSSSPARELP